MQSDGHHANRLLTSTVPPLPTFTAINSHIVSSQRANSDRRLLQYVRSRSQHARKRNPGLFESTFEEQPQIVRRRKRELINLGDSPLEVDDPEFRVSSPVSSLTQQREMDFHNTVSQQANSGTKRRKLNIQNGLQAKSGGKKQTNITTLLSHQMRYEYPVASSIKQSSATTIDKSTRTHNVQNVGIHHVEYPKHSTGTTASADVTVSKHSPIETTEQRVKANTHFTTVSQTTLSKLKEFMYSSSPQGKPEFNDPSDVGISTVTTSSDEMLKNVHSETFSAKKVRLVLDNAYSTSAHDNLLETTNVASSDYGCLDDDAMLQATQEMAFDKDLTDAYTFRHNSGYEKLKENSKSATASGSAVEDIMNQEGSARTFKLKQATINSFQDSIHPGTQSGRQFSNTVLPIPYIESETHTIGINVANVPAPQESHQPQHFDLNNIVNHRGLFHNDSKTLSTAVPNIQKDTGVTCPSAHHDIDERVELACLSTDENFDTFDDGLEDIDLLEMIAEMSQDRIVADKRSLSIRKDRSEHKLLPANLERTTTLSTGSDMGNNTRYQSTTLQTATSDAEDDYDVNDSDEEEMLRLPELISETSNNMHISTPKNCPDRKSGDVQLHRKSSACNDNRITADLTSTSDATDVIDEASPIKVSCSGSENFLQSVETEDQVDHDEQDHSSRDYVLNAFKTNVKIFRRVNLHKTQPSRILDTTSLTVNNGPLIELDPNHQPLAAFARPNFPKLTMERSPIIGLSSKTFLRTCFKIGEMFREAKRSNSFGQDAVIELFARVISSSRETNTNKQSFVFVDLWRDNPPYPEGVLQNCRSSPLVQKESSVFINEARVGEYRMARVIGRLKRDPKTSIGWLLHINHIRETDWEEIRWTKQIVSAGAVKTESTQQ